MTSRSVRSDLAARFTLALVLVLAASAPPLAAEAAHFHHVHVNATDPNESLDFYAKILGAVRVRYANRDEALFTERSFILFNQVDAPPPSALDTAVWHIGWGGIDGPNEYAWLKQQGVRFQGELNPLGANYYMYLYGPDDELIEVFTGEKNHRFNHVHLIASDVNATTTWLVEHLGLEPRLPGKVEPVERGGQLRWSNSVRVGNVSIIVFGLPDPEQPPAWWPAAAKPGQLKPTRGRPIDHIAFSFRQIEPVLARLRAGGVEIVEPIAERAELAQRSFFALAPDGLLVEIVEAKPIPDAIWE